MKRMTTATFLLLLAAPAFCIAESQLGDSTSKGSVSGGGDSPPSRTALEGLSPSQLLEMIKSADEEQSQAALEVLLPDSGSVLANFGALTAAMDSARGPTVARRMADAMRESRLDDTRVAAIARFREWAKGELSSSHPAIPRQEILQCLGRCLYHPIWSYVVPSYGVDEFKEVIEGDLGNPDYSVRNEAVKWLGTMGSVQPERGEGVIDTLRAHRSIEESRNDYPTPEAKEVTLTRISERIEMIERAVQGWKDGAGMSFERISEAEFAAIKQMSLPELLQEARKSHLRLDLAMHLILDDGCSPQEVQQFIALAQDIGGYMGYQVISALSGRLANAFENGCATDVDRASLALFVNELEKILGDVANPSPAWFSIAAEALSQVAFLTPGSALPSPGKEFTLLPESQLAIDALAGCLDHPDAKARQTAAATLGRVGQWDASRRAGILQAIRQRRQREAELPKTEGTERVLRSLDTAIRQLEAPSN